MSMWLLIDASTNKFNVDPFWVFNARFETCFEVSTVIEKHVHTWKGTYGKPGYFSELTVNLT